MQDYESPQQLLLISQLFATKANKYVLESQGFIKNIEHIETVLIQIEANWQEFEHMAEEEKPLLKVLQFLELFIVEIHEHLMLLCQTVAHIVTTQLQIQYHYALAQQAANYCQQKAQQEWQEGNENLARETLLRRKTYLDTASILKSSLEQHIPHLEACQTHLSVLQNWLSLVQQMKDKLVVEHHEEMAGISSTECWFSDTRNQPNGFVPNQLQFSQDNKLSGVIS